jgi:UDP-glucuronate 4-epimerase
MSTILLTGGAGFIGSHLAGALLKTGNHRIICIDNLDNFYPVGLKKENLYDLLQHRDFRFTEADIAALSLQEWMHICRGERIDMIVHLAAKAGVRPSIAAPQEYYRTNVTGTLNLLEFARHAGIHDFIFTSSSSVYGNNPQVPWKESGQLCPISPYAAGKIAGEHLGHVYAHLYDMRFTALRLFTVYGPRQRPDLAIHKFYNLMKADKEISLYGDGTSSRDYTFIEDIIKGILAAIDFPQQEKYNIFNIGSGRPVSLLQMVHSLEDIMHKKAKIRFADKQPGDAQQTWADISLASRQLYYRPDTAMEDGLRKFIQWKEKITMVAY